MIVSYMFPKGISFPGGHFQVPPPPPEDDFDEVSTLRRWMETWPPLVGVFSHVVLTKMLINLHPQVKKW